MPHERCSSVEAQSTYHVSVLTYLVIEDLGQDTGFLLQSRHTSENLRATLHHVCWCRRHRCHVRNQETTNSKPKNKGNRAHARREVSFTCACNTRTTAAWPTSPIIATETHGEGRGNRVEYASESTAYIMTYAASASIWGALCFSLSHQEGPRRCC